MQHRIFKFLFDINSSILSIEECLLIVKNLEEYKKNKIIRRAVERELEIIGEAISNLLKLDPSIEIEKARKIVNLRNLVIHAYDSVDDIIIYVIIVKDIPVLKKEISNLMNKYS